jgi:hypothetical protein
MSQELTQPEWDDLSAWIDGELPEAKAQQIARRVAEEPAWRDAHRQLQCVDSAMDGWDAPEPAEDLVDRICRTAPQQQQPGRLLRLTIPVTAAAAAAVLIAIGATQLQPQDKPQTPHQPVAQTPPPADSAETPEAIPDAFIVEGVDIFTVAPAPQDEGLHARIDEITGGSLSDAIGAAQTTDERWATLTGQQQQEVRRHALAFLQLDPAEQQALMASYADAVAVDPKAQAAWQQRSRWLKVVLDSFSPAQMQTLRELPPARRAQRILRRRDELRRQGKLDENK